MKMVGKTLFSPMKNLLTMKNHSLSRRNDIVVRGDTSISQPIAVREDMVRLELREELNFYSKFEVCGNIIYMSPQTLNFD